jgi:hypothetical protein
VSTVSASSAFDTRRIGNADPVPVMTARLTQLLLRVHALRNI